MEPPDYQPGSEPLRPGGSLPTLALEPAVTLRGRVLNPERRPMAEVQVQTRFSSPSPPPTARTGADGTFRLPGLQTTTAYTVEARLPGHAPAVVKAVTPEADGEANPLTLILQPGRRISGRVVDGEDRPVAGAEVILLWHRSESEEPRRLEGITDGAGEFALEDLGAGRYDVEVRARGFAPRAVRGIEVPEGEGPAALGTVVLEPGATLVGRVTDADGRPLVGVRITVESRPGLSASKNVEGNAESDAEGRFAVDSLRPGMQVDVTLDREGFLPRTLSGVRVPPEEPLTVILEAAVRISGRVVNEEGEGVMRCVVWVRLPTSDVLSATVTGEDGAFTTDDLPPGSYTLQAVAQGYVASRSEPIDAAGRYRLKATRAGWLEATAKGPIEVGAEAVTGIEVRLRRGTTLVGQVLGLDLDALAALEIVALGPGGGGTVHGEVDYQGRYRAGPLSPGDWMVRAEDPATGDQVTEMVVVEEGEAEQVVDLDFGRGVVLSGRVLQNGEPLPGAQIHLQGVGVLKVAFGSTDFEGAFRLTGLQPGSYRLTVQNSETGIHHTEAVTLEGDRELTMELSVARLRGVVRSGVDGAPLAQVGVRLLSREQAPFAALGGLGVTARTDADGRFVFDSVMDGTWLLRAEKEGYSAAEQTVEVAGPAGPTGLEVEITLPPAPGLDVEVRLPDGRPADRVQILLLDGAGAVVSRGDQATLEGGLIRLQDAPAGRYRLVVEGHNLALVETEVEIPGPRILVRLPATGWLNLRVPALVGSGPPATLAFTGSDGTPYPPASDHPLLRAAWFLQGGARDRIALPVGTWTVTVTTFDGRTWQGGVTILPGATGETGETVELTLE